ncbi:sulfurtransferase TusA family protein [Hazenella coriacea]|uniref:TusA-related sulfurtransferase n=1 Tax=Hazenella coriacea TaxID=1179467 RepID=A0A4R3L8Y5_9BACL|nr:sulfurtransferase TusA family protein [Hazenella coriacea]TCS93966.1 TusA-related sulfurtransferase [Hazenella coriacea]
MNSDQVLDCKGLSCPMPIVRTKKAMDQMESGKILEVHTTDAGSKNDITSWAQSTGNELLESKEESGTYIFKIKKK